MKITFITVLLLSVNLWAQDCDSLGKDSIFAEPAWAEDCYEKLELSPWSSTRGPTDMATAIDIGFISDNYVEHLLNDFAGQTVINGSFTTSIYGMDYNTDLSVLYGVDDNANLGTLSGGVFTTTVALSGIANVTGLTISINNDFYLSSATSLYTLDPVTGVATLVGAFGPTLMIDIAINSLGEMYGHDIATDLIYSIDTATGLATAIGATGVNSNYAQGMDFDFSDDTLYAWTYQGGGANQYGTIDLTTGALTPLSVDNPAGEFEGAIAVVGLRSTVPTMSEWGMLIFLTLFAISGLVFLRRRN